jgi:hypothetical protein
MPCDLVEGVPRYGTVDLVVYYARNISDSTQTQTVASQLDNSIEPWRACIGTVTLMGANLTASEDVYVVIMPVHYFVFWLDNSIEPWRACIGTVTLMGANLTASEDVYVVIMPVHYIVFCFDDLKWWCSGMRVWCGREDTHTHTHTHTHKHTNTRTHTHTHTHTHTQVQPNRRRHQLEFGPKFAVLSIYSVDEH